MKISELLSDESKWCKGRDAQNHNGEAVMATDDGACRWCLFGAALKCYADDYEMKDLVLCKIRDAIQHGTGLSLITEYITRWNDRSERTFSEVKALVERLGV